MIKAKEFLDIICNDYNYRFFSGIYHNGFKCLFNEMKPNFMLYVPAANSKTALGLAAGLSFTNMKSVVVLNLDNFLEILNLYKELNTRMALMPLCLVFGEENDYTKLEGVIKYTIIKTIFDLESFLLKKDFKDSSNILYIENNLLV